MNNNIDFAFLVHPRNMKDIYRKYPFAKYVPQFLVTFFLKFIGPVPVARINGINSTKGLIISLPITAEYMLKNKELARKKVVQAIKSAKKRGAKVVGLGSLTSPIVGGGVDIAGKYGLHVTNGNAFTAHMTMEGIRKSAGKMGINLSESTVAVVGATGSIGPKGDNGVSGWEKKTSTLTNSSDKTVTVTCSADKKVLGGGGTVTSVNNVYLYENYPSADNTWTVSAHRASGSGSWTLTVYAICASAL